MKNDRCDAGIHNFFTNVLNFYLKENSVYAVCT